MLHVITWWVGMVDMGIVMGTVDRGAAAADCFWSASSSSSIAMRLFLQKKTRHHTQCSNVGSEFRIFESRTCYTRFRQQCWGKGESNDSAHHLLRTMPLRFLTSEAVCSSTLMRSLRRSTSSSCSVVSGSIASWRRSSSICSRLGFRIMCRVEGHNSPRL